MLILYLRPAGAWLDSPASDVSRLEVDLGATHGIDCSVVEQNDELVRGGASNLAVQRDGGIGAVARFGVHLRFLPGSWPARMR